MQTFGKWLGRGLAFLFLTIAALWLFVPRPGVDREISFDPARLPADLDAWVQQSEQQFSDIRPGDGKRIIWAGAKGAQTPLSIVYIHGFSASPAEIRPVPDEVARALGANLFFTRLTGHGRTGAAMLDATAEAWLADMAEAMEAGTEMTSAQGQPISRSARPR